jgi:NAD-dependent SIR2 family protein deacetylase
MPLALDPSSRVLVLTGAGISAESGVPTFRDANGLWEGHDVTRVASPGLVYPAAGLVEVVRRAGGTSWLVNLESPANATRFDHVVIGPAGRELPTLFAS